MARLFKEGLLLGKLDSTTRHNARKAARALASTSSWHIANHSRDAVCENSLAGYAGNHEAPTGAEPSLSNGSQFDLNWHQSIQPPVCGESETFPRSECSGNLKFSNTSVFGSTSQPERSFAQLRLRGTSGVTPSAGTLLGINAGSTRDEGTFTRFDLRKSYATSSQPTEAAAGARPTSSDKKVSGSTSGRCILE